MRRCWTSRRRFAEGRAGAYRRGAGPGVLAFYYEDSLDQLRQLGGGADTLFSPLQTNGPLTVQGLYLGGGYPELFTRRSWSENHACAGKSETLYTRDALVSLSAAASCI